jgi:hypothetical protein
MKELGFWVIIFSLLAYKAASFFNKLDYDSNR